MLLGVSMKLIKININNYKSIASPVSFNFQDGLPTVLIGKNGSGKSNVLEALEHISSTNAHLPGKYSAGGLRYKAHIRLEKDEFEKLGADVYVTTVDGSYGIKGFVTDAMKEIDYTYFFTCGPMPMFKAIEATAVTSGQYSFEERMGCGFGACMGCSCKTKYGNKRICRDGPVLVKEEIIW